VGRGLSKPVFGWVNPKVGIIFAHNRGMTLQKVTMMMMMMMMIMMTVTGTGDVKCTVSILAM
jgi:hypothetical protein